MMAAALSFLMVSCFRFYFQHARKLMLEPLKSYYIKVGGACCQITIFINGTPATKVPT